MSVTAVRPTTEGDSEEPWAPLPAERVRGGGLLERIERGFLRYERAVHRLLPEEHNPFIQPGAVANVCFLVALVTGIVLLLWYSSSVTNAYESLEGLKESPWTGELTRSLHRYSSDACLFFVLLHAVRIFVGRRFTGPRWLAWTTGMLLFGLLWLVGWLGYWLVWDERARQVAIGSARFLDGAPLFTDPLSRSFVTDSSVGSLLFFLVFFLHMLIPLAMGIALWLHLARMARARFLTRGALTWWIVISLVVLSVLLPVESAGPAQMAVAPREMTLDAWYLLPLALTDRLSGGALWAVGLVIGAVGMSIPWALRAEKAPKAFTDTSRCNDCGSCFADCPYNAVEMVPRTDGKRFERQSFVITSRCVGCGICAGSCTSEGIGLPQLRATTVGDRIKGWLAAAAAAGEDPWRVALLCRGSAGGGVPVEPLTGRSDALPGYLVVEVPCAGWVTPALVDQVLRAGAAGVMIVACGPGSCTNRDGGRWARERMAATREPELREKWLAEGKVTVLELFRSQGAHLRRAAAALRSGEPLPESRRPLPVAAGGVLVAAVVSAIVWVGSDLPYPAPERSQPELVVTFRHAGATVESRRLTPEELESMPVHMRPRDGMSASRERVGVRLRVHVDGELALAKTYPPRGLWGDGNSIALERLPLPPGEHLVRLEIGDTADPEEWNWSAEERVTMEEYHSRAVMFDKVAGITWH